MITYIYDSLIYLLEALLYITMFCSLTDKRLRNLHHPIFYIIVDAVLSEFFSVVFPNTFGWFLGIVLCIIIYRHIYSLSTTEGIIAYSISTSIICATENLIILTLPLKESILNSLYIQAIGNLVTLLCLFVLTRIIPFHKLYILILNGSIYLKVIFADIFLLLMIQVAVGKNSALFSLEILPIVMIFVVSLVFINFLFIHQESRIQKQKQDLENYDTYQPMFQSLVDDVLGKQHDYNNQINAMKMLPYTYKDYDSLCHALTDYSDQMAMEFKESQLLKLNMKIVSGFVYSRIRQAEEQNKEFNVIIKNAVLQSKMPEYEQIRVLGILLDNALEATEAGDSISLVIDSQSDKAIYTVTNKGPFINEDLHKKMFTRGYSTKHADDSKKHGHGLNNLLDMAEKYNGKVLLTNFEYGNEMYVRFEVTI